MEFAEPDNQPYSMIKFMLIMLSLAIAVTFLLNQRKERILSDVYKKLSILK